MKEVRNVSTIITASITIEQVQKLVERIEKNPQRKDLLEAAQNLLRKAEDIPNKDPDFLRELDHLRQLIA